MGHDKQYTLGEEIGRGALGRVVRVAASDGRRFAGKILHDSHQADARASDRFAGEAKIVSELRDDNVASVHGLVEIDGENVLLMELVEGDSLARIIALDAPLAEKRILELGRGIASGLEAAHHSGLIHRDLKPENVLVARDGEVPKIVDFGLARAASFEGVNADAFAVVGTPDYMAPESIDPLAVDARSDLYALGCMLYEMAAGAPPFSGATAFALLEAHRESDVELDLITSALSPALVELVASLLAKSPADRPQSAAAVFEALTQIESTSAPTALAIRPTSTLASTGSCAECGAKSVPQIGACFGCGAPQVLLEEGGHTVFVTGPGNITEKLQAEPRERLVRWLEANPSLGLLPKRLKKRAPRLPFVLATRIAESSAAALVQALAALGFDAEAREGGRFSLKNLRKKAFALGGRMAAIVALSTIYVIQSLGPALLPILAIGGAVALATGFVAAGSPAVLPGDVTRLQLPDGLSKSFGRVTDVIPAIASARHRDGLRGVVQRVVALREVVPSAQRDTIDAELQKLLDHAVLGATRIDQIDTTLGARDLRNPNDDDRAMMRERDHWATRMLEITAFLDSMRARYASIGAGALEGDAASTLSELRSHIEALEEVSALA